MHCRRATVISQLLKKFFFFFPGYFVCPKCNIHGDWGILERLIKKAKVDSTLKDLIEKSRNSTDQFNKDWEMIIDSTTSVDKLSETEIIDLLRLFEYPVSILDLVPNYAFVITYIVFNVFTFSPNYYNQE